MVVKLKRVNYSKRKLQACPLKTLPLLVDKISHHTAMTVTKLRHAVEACVALWRLGDSTN
jgi:hypothetical protein